MPTVKNRCAILHCRGVAVCRQRNTPPHSCKHDEAGYFFVCAWLMLTRMFSVCPCRMLLRLLSEDDFSWRRKSEVPG